MSRPALYGIRVATGVRLSANLHARLLDEAGRREVSVNRLINRAVQDWLEAHEGEDV